MAKLKDGFNSVQAKLKQYIRNDWGFPFIVGFMILLFSSAVLLAINLSFWAEIVSIFAYFALLAGVLLQLVYFSKKRGKTEEGVLDGPD